MTNQWNPEEINKISTAFTQKIIGNYFQNNSRINGNEIANLTIIPQINYFVLREIFKRWEDYLDNLQSPYFDFEDPEVKKAATIFKNKLSTHISVDQENMSKLLDNAVRKTISLYQNPEAFFNNDFNEISNKTITKEWLVKNKVFFKDYGWIIGSIITNMDLHRERITAMEGLSLVRKLLDGNQEIHTDNLALILEESGVKIEIPKIKEEKKEEENDNLSFFERLVSNHPKKHSSYASFSEDKESPFDKLISSTLKPRPETAVPLETKADKEPEDLKALVNIESKPIEKQQEPKPESLKIENEIPESRDSKPGIEKLVQKTIDKSQKVPKQKSLFEDYQLKTLNDKLTSSEVVSLADRQQKSKISSLKDNMTLNQRFRYSNNLFGMDLDIFEKALVEIEQSSGFETARRLIIDKYSDRFNWDDQSEIKDEFLEFIERRFQ